MRTWPPSPAKNHWNFYTMQTYKLFVCITTSPLNSRCVENTTLMSPTALAVALALPDVFTSWLLQCEKSSICSFVVFVQTQCGKNVKNASLEYFSYFYTVQYFDILMLLFWELTGNLTTSVIKSNTMYVVPTLPSCGHTPYYIFWLFPFLLWHGTSSPNPDELLSTLPLRNSNEKAERG